MVTHGNRCVARIFQRGGGVGHTVSNIIVMAFSPRNIVGCLLKKGLQRGWGGGVGSRAPQAPLATPLGKWIIAIGKYAKSYRVKT